MDFDLTDEQRLWRKSVHDFVAREVQPKAREVDESGAFNWTAVRKMGPLGLLSLNIPEAYGGSGVDAVSAAIARKSWAGCGSTALAIAATTGRHRRRLAGSDPEKHWLLLSPAAAQIGVNIDGARRIDLGRQSKAKKREEGHQRRQNVDDQRQHRRIHHHARSHDSGADPVH
jgi:hypothetical protein